MRKQTFLKIFLLMLIFSLVLPTMTGCGLHLGADGTTLYATTYYDEEKDKGTHVIINIPGGRNTGDLGFGLNDGKGLAKRPIFAFATGETAGGECFQSAGFRLPILHYFAHYCVALVGGNMSCGPYAGVCHVDANMDLNPISIATHALGVGQRIAQNVNIMTEGLAMGLMFAIWFGNWLTMIIQERFTPEAFIKGCMTLIVGVFVIDNAVDLAGLFVNAFGGGSAPSLDVSSFANNLTMTYKFAAAGLNIPIAQIGVPLGYVFVDDLGPPILTILGCVIILLAQVQCATALASALVPAGVEIGLRVQAAPLVFALSSQTGWGPPMISYLKGCVAAGVTPVLIMTLVGSVGEFANFFNFNGIIPSAIGVAISYKIVAGFVGQMSTIVHQVISH